MYCEPCRATSQPNSWAIGVKTFRKDFILQHIAEGKTRKSYHSLATDMLRRRKRSAGVAALDMFEPELKVDSSALMVALKTMYHVIKDNNAFLKYESELDFLSSFNVTVGKANKPGNANLRSQRLKSEIIDVLGNIVFDELKKNIQLSPYISILIDETQDITTTEQLIIYAKYLLIPDEESMARCEVRTSFVGITEVIY